MAGTGDAVVKKCMFCGIDVSNSPRLKDEQGRYVCRPCAEKKMPKAQSKPAGAPAASATNAAKKAPAGEPDAAAYELADGQLDLADIAKSVQGSVLNAKPCTNCGGFIPAGGKVCTSCGFNTETGKAVKTKVEKAVQERGEKKSKMPTIHFDDSIVGIAIIGVMVSLFALTYVDVTFIGIYAVAYLLFALIYVVSLIVMPFRDGESSWGAFFVIALIINVLSVMSRMKGGIGFGGVIPLFGLGVLVGQIYYVFVVNERAVLKALCIAYFLGLIGLIALPFLHAEAIKGSFGGDDETEEPTTPTKPSKKSIVDRERDSFMPPASPAASPAPPAY